MFSFLSPDSKFMQAVAKFADLCLLNIFFLISCLPLFTIGAATAALYRVCFQMLKNEESGIFKSYFRAFRENFRQGTAAWLILLFIAVPACFYFDFFFTMESLLRYGFLLFVLIFFLALMTAAYVFPLLSRFENTVLNMLKNALILSIGNLPRSVCIVAVNILPWVIWLLDYELFWQVSFLWAALYFAAAAYFNASLLQKVFDPLMQTEA